jgi:hypothetical protein
MRSKRCGRRAAFVILFGMIQAASGFYADAGTLIERTLAFVNRKPVLYSDVVLTRALLQLEETGALERTIDEGLMFDEASRLLDDTPSEDAIARAVLALQGKSGPGFTAPALRRKALAQLAISNYIDQRLRSLVRVEDADVRKAFNDRLLNDPQPSLFSEVADAIRESLERRSLDQKIEEWVGALRLRAEIRRPSPRP